MHINLFWCSSGLDTAAAKGTMASHVTNGERRQEADESTSAVMILKETGWNLVAASSRGGKVQLPKAKTKAAARAMETIMNAAAQQPLDVQLERAYTAWSRCCAELLSLFSLAVRQSSRSLCSDSSRDETAMYAQLREGLLSELYLLSAAARSLGDTALLSRLGCALLRTGALQCYSVVLSDAARQLHPAARTACADLPDWPDIYAMEDTVEAMLGRSALTSPRGRTAAASGALRLAGEAVRLMELLGACSGSKGEPGDASGTVLHHLSRVLGKGPGAPARACGGGGTGGEQGSVSSNTAVQDEAAGPRGCSEFEQARKASSSSGHVSQLYQHATRLLLLATAAARNSATHQRTHQAASQLAEQLGTRFCCFEHENMSVICSTIADFGSAVAELVQLCAALDGGTTYGMAPGLWPLPGADGAGGAGGAEAEGSLLAKLRLCKTLEFWGLKEAPLVVNDKGQAAKEFREQVTSMASDINRLFRVWRDTEKFRMPGVVDRGTRRSLAFVHAEQQSMTEEYVEQLATVRLASASMHLPPCSPPAMLQLCMRLARGLLARGRLGGAGCSPAEAPAAGATETAEAGAGAGAANGSNALPDADATAGVRACGAGAGAATAGRGSALPAADLLPTAHRVLDRMLFQAAMGTARVVLQPHCDRPARGRAGARRLARLWGWWKVVVEAAQQGVVAGVANDSVEVTAGRLSLNTASEEEDKALPKRPSADVTAALKAGVLPCCAQLLRHSGLEGRGAGGGGSCGSGGGEAEVATSGSSGSNSGRTSGPPTEADLSQLPGRMRLFLDWSSRLSSLLGSFQACSWRQLLAFGRREEVRELTSALAWRLGWQVGQLRGEAEEGAAGTGARAGAEPGPGSGQSPEASPAAPGSGAAWHVQEAGVVLQFAAGRLGDMLWLRWQGQGEGGKGDTGRPAASPEAGTSGSGSAAEGGASCGKGDGEPGSGGGDHTSTCSEQHLEDGTNAGPGDEAEGGGGGVGSGSGASGAPGRVGTASAVAGIAARGTAMDYGRAAAELWDEVSELLPAVARGALACAEVVLVGGAREGDGGGDGGGENGVKDRGDGSTRAAVAALTLEGGQLALATWYCCMGALECASLLLLAHVEAEVAGAAGETSPWRGVLLREVQLAELLGAGVRLWGLVEPAEGWEASVQQAKALHLQLLELSAVAFPSALRAVVQGEGGAAGEAAAGSGGPPAEGSSQRDPAPWCRVTLRAVRDALGGGGGGAERPMVCRVAGSWEPEQGERRMLLEQGAGRLAAALWELQKGPS